MSWITSKELASLGIKGVDFLKILEKSNSQKSKEDAIEFAKSHLKEKVLSKKLEDHSVLKWLFTSFDDSGISDQEFVHMLNSYEQYQGSEIQQWEKFGSLSGIREWIPTFLEGWNEKDAKNQGIPSSSQIRRLLENGAIQINGFQPRANVSIIGQLPIWELIFFPNSNKRIERFKDIKPKNCNPWFDVNGHLLKLEEFSGDEFQSNLFCQKDVLIEAQKICPRPIEMHNFSTAMKCQSLSKAVDIMVEDTLFSWNLEENDDFYKLRYC